MAKSDLAMSGILLSDTMAEAGQKLLNHQVAYLDYHEPGCLDGKRPEHVHKARVAVRRMRSAMKIFRSYYPADTLDWIGKGLRRTQRVLGGVRDLDVFIENTAPFLDQLPLDSCSLLDPFLHHLNHMRAQKQAGVVAYLQGETYRAFKGHMREYLETVPQTDTLVRNRLASELYKRYEAIRAYEEHLDDISFDELHEVRIAGKELRYSLEFFEHLLGKEASSAIKAVKKLQDHLGVLNDAHVGISIVDEAINDLQDNHSLKPDTKQAIAGAHVYRGHLDKQAEEVRKTFKPVWNGVTSDAYRLTFALAISVI